MITIPRQDIKENALTTMTVATAEAVIAAVHIVGAVMHVKNAKEKMMKFTMSKVGTRYACGRTLRRTFKDKDFGLITDVKLTRVSLFVWHLSFDVEVKR